MTKFYPDLIKDYPKTTKIFIKKICHRVSSGKNALVIIVGSTGSGKSYAMLSLMIGCYSYMHGKLPDPQELINHTVYKGLELMKGLNNPDLKHKEIWGWDEVGIGAGHKTFMTKTNIVIGYLAQTFRNLQQIVFFSVPTISFVDASIRKLLHYYIETLTIDKTAKMCVCKPLYIQYNPKIDETYYHNLTYPSGDGELFEVDIMAVPKPPIEYCNLYEDKKNNFTRELNLNIQMQLEKVEAKDNPNAILTERQGKILELLESGVTSTKEIAKRMKMYAPNVCENFNFMRKKGINIDKLLGKTAYYGELVVKPHAST